jgi:hypothetical protein
MSYQSCVRESEDPNCSNPFTCTKCGRTGSSPYCCDAMTLSEARKALSSSDPKIVREAFQLLETSGTTARQAYRVALAGDPQLSWETFQDRIQP